MPKVIIYTEDGVFQSVIGDLPGIEYMVLDRNNNKKRFRKRRFKPVPCKIQTIIVEQ